MREKFYFLYDCGFCYTMEFGSVSKSVDALKRSLRKSYLLHKVPNI